MNTQTVKELRALAKERGLKGYYKLRKAELVGLLDDTPTPMDVFEKQEMMKNRLVVQSKLNEWYNWLVSSVPKSIKEPASNTFSRARSGILELYNNTKKKLGLKEVVEEQAEQEHEHDGEAEDLTPVECEQAFRGSYKSFVIQCLPKVDVETYIDRVFPNVKNLIEEQLEKLQSAKVITTMWIRWKKPVRPAFRLKEGDF